MFIEYYEIMSTELFCFWTLIEIQFNLTYTSITRNYFNKLWIDIFKIAVSCRPFFTHWSYIKEIVFNGCPLRLESFFISISFNNCQILVCIICLQCRNFWWNKICISTTEIYLKVRNIKKTAENSWCIQSITFWRQCLIQILEFPYIQWFRTFKIYKCKITTNIKKRTLNIDWATLMIWLVWYILFASSSRNLM